MMCERDGDLEQFVDRREIGTDRRAERLVARVDDHRDGQQNQRILGHRLPGGELVKPHSKVRHEAQLEHRPSLRCAIVQGRNNCASSVLMPAT
jgi:hypothetical protein